jgi:hypothetical protein
MRENHCHVAQCLCSWDASKQGMIVFTLFGALALLFSLLAIAADYDADTRIPTIVVNTLKVQP